MSLFFPKRQDVFLHIPKCGGTWVSRVVRRLGIEHRPVTCTMRVGTKHAPLWAIKDDYKSAFTFIRHPKAWYESWFKFQTANGWKKWEPNNWHPQRELEPCAAETFPEFIENVLRREPGYLSHLYQSYAPRRARGFFIGRTEDIRQDLTRHLAALDNGRRSVILKHPPENVSPVVECEWPRELLDELLRVESVAMNRWKHAGAGSNL